MSRKLFAKSGTSKYFSDPAADVVAVSKIPNYCVLKSWRSTSLAPARLSWTRLVATGASREDWWTWGWNMFLRTEIFSHCLCEVKTHGELVDMSRHGGGGDQWSQHWDCPGHGGLRLWSSDDWWRRGRSWSKHDHKIFLVLRQRSEWACVAERMMLIVTC